MSWRRFCRQSFRPCYFVCMKTNVEVLNQHSTKWRQGQLNHCHWFTSRKNPVILNDRLLVSVVFDSRPFFWITPTVATPIISPDGIGIYQSSNCLRNVIVLELSTFAFPVRWHTIFPANTQTVEACDDLHWFQAPPSSTVENKHRNGHRLLASFSTAWQIPRTATETVVGRTSTIGNILGVDLECTPTTNC